MTEWLIKTQFDASEGRWLELAKVIVRKWTDRHDMAYGLDPDMYVEPLTIETLLHAMFKIDMTAYLELGYSLTGVAWQKGNDEYPDCPVPKDLAHYLDVLEDQGWLT